jgi:hypothetical protein
MWLRDFLSKDFPRCRTMTYGYNSKLSSHGVDTILDYGRELMEEIKKIRNTKEVSGGIGVVFWKLAKLTMEFCSSNSDRSFSSHTVLEGSFWLMYEFGYS